MSQDSEHPHACPDCERTFRTDEGLRQHRYIRHGVKPIECPVCGKRVAGGKEGLKQHMEAMGC